MIKRPALREVSGNQLNNAPSRHVHIFEDTPTKTKTLPSTNNKKLATDRQVSQLKGVVKLLQMEVKFLNKKCSFLQFVNSIQKNKIRSSKDSFNANDENNLSSRPVITPKKRRLASQGNETDDTDVNEGNENIYFNNFHGHTPARHQSTVPATPISILKNNSNKNAYISSASILGHFAKSSPTNSPTKTPSRNTTNLSSQPSIKPTANQINVQKKTENLAERLKAVEDQLFKAQNTEFLLKSEPAIVSKPRQEVDQDRPLPAKQPSPATSERNVEELSEMGISPTKPVQNEPQQQPLQQRAGNTTTNCAQSNDTINNTTDNDTHNISTANIHINRSATSNGTEDSPTSTTSVTPTFSGISSVNYDEHVCTPILAEHDTLHDLFVKATNSSMKTLLRDKSVDKHHKYNNVSVYSPTPTKHTPAMHTMNNNTSTTGYNNSNNNGNSTINNTSSVGTNATSSVTTAKEILQKYKFNSAKLQTAQNNDDIMLRYTSDKTVTKSTSPPTAAGDQYSDNSSLQHNSSAIYAQRLQYNKENIESTLEASLLNYHNTISVTAPLTPLGVQQCSPISITTSNSHTKNHTSNSSAGNSCDSGSGSGGVKQGSAGLDMAQKKVVVALSSLSLLQDKMSSWKDKYNHK